MIEANYCNFNNLPDWLKELILIEAIVLNLIIVILIIAIIYVKIQIKKLDK